MKLIRLPAFLLAALLGTLSASAQDAVADQTISNTSFFAEFGGPGVLFSANLDKRFNPKSHLGLGARVGLGFVTGDTYDYTTGSYDYEQRSVLTVPVQLNYIFGRGESPHTFEVGGGLTYIGKKIDVLDFYDEDRTQLLGSFSFMYRRQPKYGGFSWRIGFTPLVGNGFIQPFAGAGVGFNF